jgi:catechol 2,3-dioxygenase-like lactoylglutathione lyase family enzyme
VSASITGVNELVLEVADLAEAERFYTGALGLPVVERWPEREAVWLMAGGRTRIGLWRPQVGLAGGRGGAHVHFALHLPDSDFDAAVERVREWGLTPEVHARGRLLRRGSRSAYVDDPDGNCVELWTQDVSRYLRGS